MKKIYQVTLDQTVHQVELLDRTANSITFSVQGETHTASLAVPLNFEGRSAPVTSARVSREPTPAAPSTPGSVPSPMPGIVAKILCSPGERVTKGTPIIIIEAMKMENNISAPADGEIARIAVAAGEEVKKGQVLLEMTPA